MAYTVIDTASNNTLLQPVYMAKKDEDVDGQAEKINEVIQNGFNEYMAKIQQPESPPISPHNLVKKTSAYIANLIDIGWGAMNTLSFVMNTTGMKAYDTFAKNAYPLFSIKRGSPIGEIVYFGTDDYTTIGDILNSYGYITYTYNSLANEQQISWIAYDDMPDKNWYVYAQLGWIREE